MHGSWVNKERQTILAYPFFSVLAVIRVAQNNIKVTEHVLLNLDYLLYGIFVIFKLCIIYTTFGYTFSCLIFLYILYTNYSYKASKVYPLVERYFNCLNIGCSDSHARGTRAII